MEWDQRYHQLQEGEVIQATDESLESDHPWHGGNEHWKQVPPHMVGRKAPDPLCPAHTVYRRKKETVIVKCDHIGVALTTPVRVMDMGDKFEARAGCAILGSTNMTNEQMDAQGRDPFGDDWRDNFVRGEGETAEAAVDALRQDARSMAESIWAF